MVKNIFILEEHLNKNKIDLFSYSHVRTYHACRPTNIEDYMKQGIKSINKKTVLQEAIQRMKSDDVSESEIREQFLQDWKDFDDIHKQVWLALNKDVFFEGAGHYLIYGSEFINALAMKIGCRYILKNVGLPTIFQCDVPIGEISPSQIFDLENMIENGYISDLTIAVHEVLPEDISDYWHPVEEIDDPYYYGLKYKANYHKLVAAGYYSSKIVQETDGSEDYEVN